MQGIVWRDDQMFRDTPKRKGSKKSGSGSAFGKDVDPTGVLFGRKPSSGLLFGSRSASGVLSTTRGLGSHGGWRFPKGIL